MSNQPKTIAVGQISGANGFRALACIGVFLSHVAMFHCPAQTARLGWLGKLIEAGNTGLAGFFVLSGFLLSIPFWKSFHAGSGMPNLKVYAVRRLARIVPGYYACLLITALVAQQFTSTDGWMQVVSCLTFTNSLFDETFAPSFNTPLWSIGIEMLFYVILPLFGVGLFLRRSAKWVWGYTLAVITLIMVGQYALVQLVSRIDLSIGGADLHNDQSWAVERNAVVLFTHFLVGVLASYVLGLMSARYARADLRGKWNRFDVCSVGLIVAILLLLGTPIVGHIPVAWRLWRLPLTVIHWPMLHILFAGLLITMALSGRVGRWIDSRPLSSTAVYSFGIYMWHIPILAGLARIWPAQRDSGLLGAIAFAVAGWLLSYQVATLSYELIEHPVLEWARSYKPAAARRSETHTSKIRVGV